jgi:hypothetical protein
VLNQPLTNRELAVLTAVGRHPCLAPRLKDLVPLLKVLRDLCCGGLPREAFGLKVHHGVPKAGATPQECFLQRREKDVVCWFGLGRHGSVRIQKRAWLGDVGEVC